MLISQWWLWFACFQWQAVICNAKLLRSYLPTDFIKRYINKLILLYYIWKSVLNDIHCIFQLRVYKDTSENITQINTADTFLYNLYLLGVASVFEACAFGFPFLGCSSSFRKSNRSCWPVSKTPKLQLITWKLAARQYHSYLEKTTLERMFRGTMAPQFCLHWSGNATPKQYFAI